MKRALALARLERGVTRVAGAGLGLLLGPYTQLASLHRAGLRQTVFVGVTGSCGKTTAKDLIAAVLSTRYRGSKSPASHNHSFWTPHTVLAARRRHRFCVVEIGSWGPGSLDAPVRLVRPKIAVVLGVQSDHVSSFRTREATAAEKSKLVSALGADGIAVLNADDPHVLAMRNRSAGGVVTFGRAEGAAVRAERVTSRWPERLSFIVRVGAGAHPVRTRLCGAHWVHPVLAAIAVGLEMGVPLADAIGAVERVEPWIARMQPVVHPDAVTFVRDDYKAPLWSIVATLDFLRDATAARKIIVLGTISDYRGSAGRAYAAVARQALDVADHVFFVGRQAERCLKAKSHPRGAALKTFESVQEAAEYLRAFRRPGDLIVLKGSNRADHLSRLAMDGAIDRPAPVACWRSNCRKLKFCEECRLVDLPFAPEEASG